MNIKNVKLVEWNISIATVFLNTKIFNKYEFSNHDNNTFILLLWKGVFLYEYINDWEKFSGTLLPEK